MPLPVSRLRHWFAAAAIVAVATVAGAYFYARYRVQSALNGVSEKIAQGIQQSAEGFTFSKSEQGRTLYKIQARKFVQFKQGGHAELRDVTITFYGRGSSRFDQIYGSDFEYDPASGDVSAKGEVQIDLEANPAGLTSSDQSTPKELENPIHLRTSGLVFNQKTQDAHTSEKVEFRIPQASGSAQGVSYSAKTRTLTLESQINVEFIDPAPGSLAASRGMITDEPRAVTLLSASLQRGRESITTDQATISLRQDNNIERITGTGHVRLTSQGAKAGTVEADQAELILGDRRGELRSAVFSGDVKAEGPALQGASSHAGRVTIHFAAKNIVTMVRADSGVRLLRQQNPSPPSTSAQTLQVTSPAVDFYLTRGRHLDRAETSAGAEIAIKPSDPTTGETHITAGKFDVHFDALGQLVSLHGAPNARVVSSIPKKPDRVSTSDMLDIAFAPGAGMETVTQRGSVVYADDERKAWAETARYTPADQRLIFAGAPRVVQGGMTTTAQTLRLDRLTSNAFADGDVKTTYSDLKPQAGGGLLASSSPIHVTARSMTVHGASATASYSGGVRLWQDANLVAAPSIDFDRDRRSIVAKGSATQSVSTSLVQLDKKGRVTPVSITSARLTYVDSDRRVRFEGGVSAKASDFSITTGQMDVFLRANTETSRHQSIGGPSQLDRIVAQDQVRIRQSARNAEGDRLVYTAADDKFVLSGGSPSIFDAEHGKITGVSLTLFRADDRVLVEGNGTSPSVTQTQMAR
jgi:lipopolysaccharide export system protein LptA